MDIFFTKKCTLKCLFCVCVFFFLCTPRIPFPAPSLLCQPPFFQTQKESISLTYLGNNPFLT